MGPRRGSDPLALSGLLVMLQHPRGAEKRQQGMGGTGAPSAALRPPPFSSPSLFQLILLVPADFAPEAVTAVTFFPVAGFGDHPAGGGGAGSSSCDPHLPCSWRPRPCWRRLFSSRLFEPCFSLSGSKDPRSLTFRDLTVRQAGLSCGRDRAVRPEGSAQGAGGQGQLSEDLEHHLENLPRG